MKIKSKILTPLVLAVSLTGGSSLVFADNSNSSLSIEDKNFITSSNLNYTQDQLNDPSIINFIKQGSKEKAQRLETYNKIKNDPDFEIIADNGNGIYAYTYSEKIKTDVDKERFLRKAEGLSAQQTVEAWNNTGLKSATDLSLGYLETHFTDTVTDTDPWSGQEELRANGNGTIQWFKGTNGSYTYWTTLDSISDNFQVDYDTVSSTESVTATVSGGTTTSVSGGVSSSVTKGTSTATLSISWPSKGTYNYYSKSYGDVYVKTDNITKYTHTASSVATTGGYHVWGSATKSVSIS
ncbi:hypothetical protein PASE110613_05490 [Paenibacillus sediminis]|uniref:Uncharacterized protein n=1 Tax=Paenibacillus sediminis TaxID=664909 RepID=A0ABS4H140_9BACL|nr:hypothetical protein [Paenibacillus sediminis]MBP1936230.1 hypothetical protein [Paenibacillus sediminis]